MSEIWELVHQGEGHLAKTWDTPPVPVCKACRKKKPDHRKDCPIASLLADRKALVRYVREKRALRVSYLNPPDGKELDGVRAAYEAFPQETKDEIEHERP